MRQWINLVEAWDKTVAGTFDHVEHLDVFRNPSRSEFQRLLKESKGNQLRGEIIRDTNDLIVWDAWYATHGDMREHYRISDVYLLLSKDGVLLNDFYYRREDSGEYGEIARTIWEIVASNPHLKRIYGDNFRMIGLDDAGDVVWNGQEFVKAS